MAKPASTPAGPAAGRPGERAHERVGDDRQQVGDEALPAGPLDIGRTEPASSVVGSISNPLPAAASADQSRDRQRQRRHCLEVEQRLDADTPDL